MLSFLFGGLGNLVAPPPNILHEFQLHMKSSNFREALKLLTRPDHGININEIVYDEFYPLHLACAAGELELTLELISQGADVCALTTSTQNNPLHFAARNGQKSIVEILLRSGADPSIPNAHGLIPAELTKDNNILTLLMRTNWMSQRPAQYEASLELLLQNMTLARVPSSDQEKEVQSSGVECELKNKKTITIAIPESTGELNLPYQGHSKFTGNSVTEKREKPNRRYSLPAGHPAIRLVDSPQKREYRVLNEKQSTRRGTPPSLTPVVEESMSTPPLPPPPPPPPLPVPLPLNSSHNLPLPLPVPHNLKKESPQSPVTKKKLAPTHPANPAARLKYSQVGEGIGSPLNLPSKSRKGLQPKSLIPASLSEKSLPAVSSTSSSSSSSASVSVSSESQDPTKLKVKSSLANIWNQTDVEFSDDDDDNDNQNESNQDGLNTSPEMYQKSANNPGTLSPVITNHMEIPPRAQSGSRSASHVTHGMRFILPPPSTSPSFPLSLTSSSNPTNEVTSSSICSDLYGNEQKEYYDMLSPNSSSLVDVAPIVPVDIDPRVPLSEENFAITDDFDNSSIQMIDVGVQVSIGKPSHTVVTSQGSMNDMREEMNGILQEGQTPELLEKMVLQAAKETAYSYNTVNTLGAKRKAIFKACQQIQSEVLEELKTMLMTEPELANCRSCGVLSNFAPDGSTPLHCASRWGNLEVVTYLLSLKKDQTQDKLVDVWSRDLQGRVALHLAAEYEHEAVCRVLISAMTDINRLVPSSPVNNISIVGSSAPLDLTGTTPLGWASRRKKGRPSSPIRELLFGQGDGTILPHKQYLERSGKTPIRRAYNRTQSRNFNHELQPDHVVFAQSEAQGWRPEMEDALLTRCPLFSTEEQTYWLFGVFDGHGGDFSSTFAAKTLPSIFTTALSSQHSNRQLDLRKLLYDSCLELDSLLSEEERMKVSAKHNNSKGDIKLNIRDTSGTTACVCLLTLEEIFLANIGDSRAVLARTRSVNLDNPPIAIPLSVDQKLSLTDERSRAEQAGCLVQKVDGSELYEISSSLHSCKLRLARSIGDFYLKWGLDECTPEQFECPETRGSYKSPIIRVSGTTSDGPTRYLKLHPPNRQGVSCEPVIVNHNRILSSDLFILIACDGVWDVISNEDAVSLIHAQLIQNCQSYSSSNNTTSLLSDENLQHIASTACDNLLLECLQRRSNDNMTALLILFPMMNQILRETFRSSQTAIYSPSFYKSNSTLSMSPEIISSPSNTPFYQRIHPTEIAHHNPHNHGNNDYSLNQEVEGQDERERRPNPLTNLHQMNPLPPPPSSTSPHHNHNEVDSPMKGKKLFV